MNTKQIQSFQIPLSKFLCLTNGVTVSHLIPFETAVSLIIADIIIAELIDLQS